MYKLCKTEQSANRQRALEQGLLAAMEVSPFDEISISDLCDRLGVPRKSFYRYFSGKEGALHGLIDHTLERYELTVEQGVQQELIHYFRFWREQKPLLDALQRSDLYDVLVLRAVNYTIRESRIQSYDGQMGQREYALLFSISGLMAMVIHWHQTGYREPVQQMARMANHVLSRPLLEEI